MEIETILFTSEMDRGDDWEIAFPSPPVAPVTKQFFPSKIELFISYQTLLVHFPRFRKLYDKSLYAPLEFLTLLRS